MPFRTLQTGERKLAIPYIGNIQIDVLPISVGFFSL